MCSTRIGRFARIVSLSSEASLRQPLVVEQSLSAPILQVLTRAWSSDTICRGDKEAIHKLHSFLKEIMWRNSKADVANEIQLPGQSKTIVEVRFSPVEKYFYKKQSEQVLIHSPSCNDRKCLEE